MDDFWGVKNKIRCINFKFFILSIGFKSIKKEIDYTNQYSGLLSVVPNKLRSVLRRMRVE